MRKRLTYSGATQVAITEVEAAMHRVRHLELLIEHLHEQLEYAEESLADANQELDDARQRLAELEAKG